MAFEVEQKFRVPDFAAVERRLTELHASLGEAKEQRDLYLSHPARDFAATDEALRLRRVGDQNLITYKGPKVDTTTKTRREIELPLAAGDKGFEQFRELFLALGFQPVGEVVKQRRTTELSAGGFEIEIALDEIVRLGTFVELETQAESDQLPAARAALANLAQQLGLSENERRSYLELMLASK